MRETESVIMSFAEDALTTATRLQRELEKHNLLRRKYQGKGKPAKLYVLTVPKISAESP